MKFAVRSMLSAFVAVFVVAVLCCQQAVGATVALTSGHLLVLGGNSNPQGVGMDKELDGYISGNPGTEYAGYGYQVVTWSAQTPFSYGSDGTTFDASQREGVGRIITAVTRNYAPGEKIVVVGYSSSASVVTKYIRALQAARDAGEALPSPDDLSFIVFGNPNRPNGGLLARYPGLVIPPPFGATFDGPATPSDYQVTDISWQYDGFSDFPSDPRNLLALANALVGIVTLHNSYYGADITNPAAILSDSTVGNTRYITLKSTLPLLAPLYAFIPPVFLGGLDAVLRAEIEKGYDRSVSAGVPTPGVPLFGPAPTTTSVPSATRSTVLSARAADSAATSTPAATTSEAQEPLQPESTGSSPTAGSETTSTVPTTTTTTTTPTPTTTDSTTTPATTGSTTTPSAPSGSGTSAPGTSGPGASQASTKTVATVS